MSTTAYPLSWPSAYPRSRFQQRAPYKAQFARARDHLLNELRLMGAKSLVLSTNIPLRLDGIPYAGMAQPQDKGVAIYFLRSAQSLVLACDKWNRVDDNIRAIGLSVEAMRGMDRWGCSDMLNRVFTGFTALPAPENSVSAEEWWEILGVAPYADLQFIEEAYRSKAKKAHPDLGGSTVQMAQLNRAIEEARAARGAS